MLFVGTSIIHPSTEGVFLLCNILDLLIYRFQYSGSVPDYLLWNGNLAIAESDVRYALIIWIKPFHQGISQGVLFNDYKDLNTQIMLSSSKKAEDQEDQWIVDENSTILTTIFEKANKVWNLGLK